MLSIYGLPWDFYVILNTGRVSRKDIFLFTDIFKWKVNLLKYELHTKGKD